MIWNSQKHLYEKIKILFYALLKIFVLYFKKEKYENIPLASFTILIWRIII